MPRPPKPHQQQILDAFDAGEKSAAELARLHGYTPSGVALILRRYGRAPRTLAEANATRWTPECRIAQGETFKAMWARIKADKQQSA